jgi:hypothetical protein
MATANVGVPMSFFTMSNCKGNQSVSQQQNLISPPTTVVAAPYNRSALITFTPSTGAYYTVISNPGNILTIGSSSPILISGLTNGLLYTFTVSANASGSSGSIPSVPSIAVLINPVPLAPSNIVVAPSSGSTSISFTPSLYALSYTATSNPGSITVTGTSSPIVISGLTNGISYTFAMTATNASGTSTASITSPVLVAPIPDAPIIIGTTPLAASASISFTPSLYGISYTAISNPGGITATGSSSPILVYGLTNGISYTFAITATNASGTSTASITSPVLVVPVPAPPTNIVGTPSATSASISFIPSLYGISYTAISSPGGITATGSSSPILVSGLTNGLSYTFAMTATNATGTSILSVQSYPVLINPVPLTPSSIIATPIGSGSASISFTLSVNATVYIITSNPDGKIAFGTSSPIIISGLTIGLSYTFSIKATNASGTSGSITSAPVII